MKKTWILLLVAAVTIPLQSFIKTAWADVGYDKGFYILSEDKNFKFNFRFQIAPRHEYIYRDVKLDTNTFSLSRLRTFFTGHAFSPKYRYFLTVEYSGSAGSPTVRDGFVELDVAAPLTITVGQFGVELDREDIYSPTTHQLIGFSKMYDHFGIDRDLGLQFTVKAFSRLTSYAFIFNGDGQSTKNKNTELVTGARLAYAVLGESPGAPGDYDYSENPNLEIGTTFVYDWGAAAETKDFDSFVKRNIAPFETRLVRGDGDGIFTWRGFSTMGQWQFASNSQYRSFDHGFMIQSGYYLVKKKFEVAGRYSATYPDFPFPALAQTGQTSPDNGGNGSGGIPIYEYTGGMNYYFKGHQFKVQTTYSFVRNQYGILFNNEHFIRSQLMMTF